MQRLDDKSRMSGDVHVRFCERLEGRFLRATRLSASSSLKPMLSDFTVCSETGWASSD